VDVYKQAILNQRVGLTNDYAFVKAERSKDVHAISNKGTSACPLLYVRLRMQLNAAEDVVPVDVCFSCCVGLLGNGRDADQTDGCEAESLRTR
jgi:hypothetical protein